MSARIVIDAMGGDNSPSAEVGGALRAAREIGVSVLLAGDERIIRNEIDRRGRAPAGVEIIPADGAIGMKDPPSAILKEKSGCSMAVAADAVRDGYADALVSAGNTGALFTVASLKVRRLPGIRRAALGAIVPLENPVLIVDSGANTDATPELLQLFAYMGSLYCSLVMGVEKPRVALINNGAESTKGTPLYSAAHSLLAADGRINFIGNAEGRDVPSGFCDVVVCDGFTGNILLKTIEGMGLFMNRSLKNIFHANALTLFAGLLTRSKTNALKKQVDHREHGGAPFLGLAKPVVKAHGSSDEKSIFTAIRQAKTFHESGLISKLGEEFTD